MIAERIGYAVAFICKHKSRVASAFGVELFKVVVVNITGLEIVVKENNSILSSNIFRLVPMKDLYRLGLTEIYSYRSLCQKVPPDARATLEHMNEALSIIIEMGSKPFPSVPKFIREDGTFE